MSDRLVKDFDLYYAENKNFTDGFSASSHEIQTDKLLSRAGKSEKIAELTVKHEKNINELAERFTTDFSKRLENIDSQLNGSRSDIRIGQIQARLKKGETISPDDATRLLLNDLGENKTLMKKSNFQNMMANSDEKQLRKTAQTLNDNEDVEKLSWLKELVFLKGDEVLSNTLEAQISGLKDAQLSDEQRKLKTVSEKIQKGIKLFEYSLERSRTGIFLDVRENEIQ